MQITPRFCAVYKERPAKVSEPFSPPSGGLFYATEDHQDQIRLSYDRLFQLRSDLSEQTPEFLAAEQAHFRLLETLSQLAQ